MSPEGEIDGVPAHQRVEATVPGSAAQQYRIEKFSYQRDHDVGSAAQFMAVAFDEPHRPAHPLQFLTVLGNQRPMSDGLPFGDELVFGAHECHPWTSQRRDGISRKGRLVAGRSELEVEKTTDIGVVLDNHYLQRFAAHSGNSKSRPG